MDSILKEASKILKTEIVTTKRLNGATDSLVLLINDKYILKLDKPLFIEETVKFLNSVDSNYFTKVIYHNKEKSFILYEYIEGEKLENCDNINYLELLKTLYQITLSYQKSDDLYGQIEYKFDSWIEFLKNDMTYCKNNIHCLTDIDFQLINLEINNLNRFSYDKVLMHGDFGTHNFIFKDNKLAGVIDPQPVVGDGLYDYFAACVSNVLLLKNLTLEQILSIPNAPKSKMKSMLLIALYDRIHRCIKHHPQDLDFYLQLFNSIKTEEYHYYINNFI